MSIEETNANNKPSSWVIDSSWTPDKHNEPEQFWVKLQKWLEQKGYVLRPRFREGWVASWKERNAYYNQFEDGQVHTSLSLMDATRTSDGAPVMLKVVRKKYHPFEVEIAQYLSSEPRVSDPQNHCVAIYEVFQVPDDFRFGDSEEVIMVMPFLRRYDNPRFDTVGEAVEFFAQIFENLAYLHGLNIAHRDCNSNNIMMDAQHLYPHSWHPVRINRKPDFKGKSKYYHRTHRPVKYYFIDFGLSRRYKPEERPPLEDIILGGDRSPPEHHIQGVGSCDPFPTDVYYLGNLIRQDFIDEKSGFGFMESLVDDMTAEDAAKRPTMDEVVTRFEVVRKSLSSWKLRSRVTYHKDFAIGAPFRIVPHWVRRIRYIVTRTPAIPAPTP